VTPWLRRLLGVANLALLAAAASVVQPHASAVQNPVTCPNRVSLVNGSFESPVVGPSNYSFFTPAETGWNTTDVNSAIEYWSDTFLGGSAVTGRQWAELEAYGPAQMSQDVATTPGQTIYWRLSHTSRAAGPDVAQVRIGSVAEGNASPVVPTDTGITQLSDANQVWAQYRGSYVVPPGQTMTHFGIESVSNSWGLGGGNHLDDVVIETPACVIVTKSAFDASGAPLADSDTVPAGSVVTYRINAINDGGVAATDTRIDDTLPDGVDYVADSMRIVDGPGVGALTDTVGDDAGEVASTTVTARIGSGATSSNGGSLAATPALPGGVTLEFQVRVRTTASALLTNDATVTSTDTLGQIVGVVSRSNASRIVVPATTTTSTTTTSTTIALPANIVPPTTAVEAPVTANRPEVAVQPSIVTPSSTVDTSPTTTTVVTATSSAPRPQVATVGGQTTERELALTGNDQRTHLALASALIIVGAVTLCATRRPKRR
jgi:uncharacterized repeat protein (TIGR01451 family)